MFFSKFAEATGRRVQRVLALAATLERQAHAEADEDRAAHEIEYLDTRAIERPASTCGNDGVERQLGDTEDIEDRARSKSPASEP